MPEKKCKKMYQSRTLCLKLLSICKGLVLDGMRQTERNKQVLNETYIKSSTSRLHTPESITACIFSLGPSAIYDNAQHASDMTS